MNTRLRAAPTLLFIAVLLGLAGCVSTQKRYDKAQDLEAQGRYVEAAEYYIKVLEKEAQWEGAPERLQEASDHAIALLFDEADAARREGDYDDALRALDHLDELHAAAAAVGVTLDWPEDYASYRQEVAQTAVADLLRRGERAEQAGDWREALDAYERAARYTDDPERQAEFSALQANVHLQWAQYDFDSEYYRAGFDRAQHTIDLVRPGHPLAERAVAFQESALASGTRFVAFLPFWRTDDVYRTAPGNVVPDLNDVLLYEHWSAPLLFIAAADPVQLRRELRRLRYDRTVITRRQASEIGRVAGADYVVVGEWTVFERKERNIKEKTRRVRMKGRRATTGGATDTTFIEQTLTLEFEAEVAFRIIDPRTRREVDNGTIEADVSGRVTRGVFDGDYRDLDLSGSQLSLFEDDERLAEEELGNELVDRVAERLAERVYDRLLRLIP